MATSGSFDFTLNRNQIVRAALRKVGAYDSGGNPTNEEISDAVEALNVMVKHWQTRGVFLWTIEEDTYTFLATGDQAFTPDASDMIDIHSAWMRETSGDDTPVQIISKTEYDRIDSKDDASNLIDVIAFDKQLSPQIYVWPTLSNLANVLHFRMVRALEDFDTSTDTPDFPVKWISPLIWNLALEIAPEYDIHQTRYNRIEKKAAETFKDAKGDDTDTVECEFVAPSFGR